MKPYLNLSISRYLSILASPEPVPGGGSVAALVASLGVGLGEMVCSINVTRKVNLPVKQEIKSLSRRLAQRRKKLLRLLTQDSLVFQKVSKLWKAPPQKLNPALKKAALVPLEIARIAQETAHELIPCIGQTSKHLMSDLSEAGYLLQASFRSARMNVEINLRLLDKVEPAWTTPVRQELDTLEAGLNEDAATLVAAFGR